jgi:DNA-binding NtrC family response regulator
MDETLTIARPGKIVPHRLKLTVVAGPNNGATFVGKIAVVGRAPQVDLRLTDPSVSSFHVELRAETSGIAVRDLESHNGTSYEGARVERAIVPTAALLVLGGTTIKVEQENDDDASAMQSTFGPLIGASSAMQAVFAWLARVAKMDVSLLVEGPAGSGKEAAARAVHAESRFASGPFVVLDCVAVPPAADVFDAKEGGIFHAANGGTLFLDDVGELDAAMQARLLRALEAEGPSRPRSDDEHPKPRVIAASRRELRREVNQGRFREELYLRIAQARAVLPPLDDRREDIPALAMSFVVQIPATTKAARRIAPEAMEELTRREYRGNVRELRAVVERAAMIAAGTSVTTADLAFEHVLATHAEKGEVETFKDAKRTVVDEFERHYLEELVARVGDNLSQASILSGVDRHHLRDLLRKHGLRKG